MWGVRRCTFGSSPGQRVKGAAPRPPKKVPQEAAEPGAGETRSESVWTGARDLDSNGRPSAEGGQTCCPSGTTPGATGGAGTHPASVIGRKAFHCNLSYHAPPRVCHRVRTGLLGQVLPTGTCVHAQCTAPAGNYSSQGARLGNPRVTLPARHGGATGLTPPAHPSGCGLAC